MDIDKVALDRYITGNWGEDSVPDDDADYFTLTFSETVELLGLLEKFQENFDVVSSIGEHESALLQQWIEKLGRAEM